jgi:hypothetical protein
MKVTPLTCSVDARQPVAADTSLARLAELGAFRGRRSSMGRMTNEPSARLDGDSG